MEVKDVLSFIELAANEKEVETIRNAAYKQGKILAKESAEREATAAWSRVKSHKPGDTLYCCASGTFLGGPLQRGDKVTVLAIQPRKKLLWVTVKGKKNSFYFTPRGIARYDLRQFPPEKPITQDERKLADNMGNVLKNLNL